MRLFSCLDCEHTFTFEVGEDEPLRVTRLPGDVILSIAKRCPACLAKLDPAPLIALAAKMWLAFLKVYEPDRHERITCHMIDEHTALRTFIGEHEQRAWLAAAIAARPELEEHVLVAPDHWAAGVLKVLVFRVAAPAERAAGAGERTQVKIARLMTRETDE